jgi:hypothetical protein
MTARRLLAVGLMILGVSVVGISSASSAGVAPPAGKLATSGPAFNVTAASIDELGAGLGSRWLLVSGRRSKAELDAPEGSIVEAEVRVTASLPLHAASIEIQSTGPLAVPGGRTIRLGELASGMTRLVPVRLRITAPGSGTIDARMVGYAGAARIGSDAEIGYATGAGQVAFSLDGQLAAQVAALSFLRPLIGERRYEARRLELLGGGASWQISVGPSRTKAVPATTKVSGTITYTASNASKHPARTITVEIIDATGGAGTVVATTTTNASGQYSATVSTLRSDKKTPRKLFVDAEAKGSGFVIDPVGSATPQHIDSGTLTASGRPITINVAANNAADNNTAFDVADALVSGVQYTERINGGRIFGNITASFPNPAGTNFNPATGTAAILEGDRFDWDVILHEFGHYVASKLGIDHSPGGPHSFTQNLGEPPRTKGQGILLAWSEGFATWFAITAEWVLGTSALHIPNVGDTYYDDTEDANIHENLATNAPDPSIGEDNELSVARTLWHFFIDPDIKMSDLTIIDTLKASAADTLSEAVAALLPAGHAVKFGSTTGSAAEVQHTNDFACVMTNQQVSPSLTAPVTNTTIAAGSPQTYTWLPYGAGPSNRLDSFVVQFWSQDWGKLLYASPQQAATTYTPNAKVWQNLILNTQDEKGNLPSQINVVVVGWGMHAPVTGPYNSCAITEHVARITAVGIATADNDGKPVIASMPTSPACLDTDEVPAQLNQFNLNGTNLPPNTAYTLTLHDPAGTYPDQTLQGTWTSNASGGFTGAQPVIPAVPSLTTWQLIATPVSGPIPLVVTPIGWTTCIEWYPDANPMPIEWGGSGLGPNSSATDTFAGTPEPSITADGSGLYDGTYQAACTTASPIVSVAGTFLDGTAAQVTYQITNMCTPAGGGTGTTGTGTGTTGNVTLRHGPGRIFVIGSG